MGSDGACVTNSGRVMAAVSQQRTASNDDGGNTPLEEVRAAQRASTCQTCALSKRPLWPPIVADKQGTIYLRSAVLELLVARKSPERATPAIAALVHDERFSSVKKLSSVRELLFSSPAAVKTATAPSASLCSRLITCPLTEANLSSGTVPFGFWWECGHVMATASRGDSGCSLCSNGTTWISVVGAQDGGSDPKRPRKQTSAVS